MPRSPGKGYARGRFFAMNRPFEPVAGPGGRSHGLTAAVAIGLTPLSMGVCADGRAPESWCSQWTAVSTVSEEWVDLLHELLCYLYIIYGGDCDDLENLELSEIHGVIGSAILINGTLGPADSEVLSLTSDIDAIVIAHAVEIDLLSGEGLAQDYLDLTALASATSPPAMGRDSARKAVD